MKMDGHKTIIGNSFKIFNKCFNVLNSKYRYNNIFYHKQLNNISAFFGKEIFLGATTDQIYLYDWFTPKCKNDYLNELKIILKYDK
jgi:hypothetical protein